MYHITETIGLVMTGIVPDVRPRPLPMQRQMPANCYCLGRFRRAVLASERSLTTPR